MKVSLRWLRSLAPELDDSPQRLAERLALLGAPVEEWRELGGELEGVVVARVRGVRRHPNADRLSLCEVEAGAGEPLQVVCGAPNVRPGALYPFAPVGAALPGGVKVRAAKIRGETSEGMLCSARELGLGRDHAGILELNGGLQPGESLAPAIGLDDVRLEVEITANRGDLLCHYGIAREVAPGGESGLRLPAFPGGEALAGSAQIQRAAGEGSAAGVPVRIEDPDGCSRYLAAVILGVRVAPSPGWLSGRLRAIGLRPINSVVDATNYVLHELGQPLHAFDLDRLAGPGVLVRRARKDDVLVTLDGVERALDASTLVIADRERPVAVAGVMGGEESEVTEGTENVLLECALFNAKTVRGARRALELDTDASHRFERGVDPEGLERAARRALALILEVAGGEVEGVVDLQPRRSRPALVRLRPARVAHLLGVKISEEEVKGLLEPLGFQLEGRSDQAVEVRVPGHRRGDVTREQDLIEEVARRRGYDSFPDELRPFRPSTVPEDRLGQSEDLLRDLLVGRGFLEQRSAPLVPGPEGDVPLLNPLSEPESRLRRALSPGLAHRVEYNFARGARDVRLFEIGTVFAPAPAPDTQPGEETRLAALFTGRRRPPHWTGEPGPFEVWDAKELLERLAALLHPGARVEQGGCPPPLEPSGGFRLLAAGGELVGWGGFLLPTALDAPPWADPVWAIEVRLPAAGHPGAERRVCPLPVYPVVERDLALLVPAEVPAAEVKEALSEASGEQLESVRLFDLYAGEGVSAGERSLAWRLTFRAPDRTLTDGEVDAAVERVTEALRERWGVRRR